MSISINPSTGETIGAFPSTTTEELRAIFSNAGTAFEKWSMSSFDERIRCLTSLKNEIINRSESISEILTREMGKPLLESYLHEIFTSVEYAAYFERKLKSLIEPKRIPIGIRRFEKRRSLLYRMPYGEVVLFPPPGAPFADTVKNLFSPILAGNSVVVKAPQESVAIIKRIEALFKASHFPDHLVQFVYGDDSVTELLLEYHFKVVTYMGTRSYGEYIIQKTQHNHPKLIFEFESSDPMIITAQANIDMAVRGALFAVNANAGQLCTSTERIYVHETLFEEFSQKLIKATEELRIGDGFDTVDLGPLLSKAIYDNATAIVEKLKKKCTSVIEAGHYVGSVDRGYFVKPTIILDEDLEADEKLYGPTVVLQKYSDDDTVIQRVNSSPLARSVSLWSTDIKHAQAMATAIQRPSVLINEVLGIADPRLPWQGMAQTGRGIAHGTHALWHYTYEKHVHIHTVPKSGSNEPPFWFPYRPLHRGKAISFLRNFNANSLIRKLFSISKYFSIFK